MKVIGLTGGRNVGKDTFADILECKSITARYSFARPLYEMLETLLGDKIPMKTLPNGRVTYDKDAIIEPYGCNLRHFLCTLGTDWGRKMIDDNIWVFKAEEWFNQLADKEQLEYVIFTDVRYDNEAFLVADKLGGKIVKVSCQEAAMCSWAHKKYDSDRGIDHRYIGGIIHNYKNMDIYASDIDRVVAMLFKDDVMANPL